MSMLFDKGRFKSLYESENKFKTNTTSTVFSKNNNNRNKSKTRVSQEDFIKNFICLSPNNKRKENTLIKIYNNSTMNKGCFTRNSTKKEGVLKKVQYNHSFEGEIIDNESINNIDYNNNKNQKQGLYVNNKNKKNSLNINKAKYKSNSNMNKTDLFFSGNKSKTNNKIGNKMNKNIIKKLNEKFKSLENNIIDKKYENDLDHDEIILTTNRKTEDISKSTESKNNNNYNLCNIINNYNIDENLINSSFENNKNDFNLMYIENYSRTIPDEMLNLEIRLIFEKIMELQKSYHHQLEEILNHYFQNKKEYFYAIYQYDCINKKIVVLKKLAEKNNRKENQNCLGVCNKKNYQDISDINRREFALWKNMMNFEEIDKYQKEKKNKLKEIFELCIFERYHKIKNMNDIEKQLIHNLIKKNKYTFKNENEENTKSKNKNNVRFNKYKEKIITLPSSTQSQNKSSINYNSNNNKINNKKSVNYSHKRKKI